MMRFPFMRAASFLEGYTLQILHSMGTHVALLFRGYFTHILRAEKNLHEFPWLLGIQGLNPIAAMLHATIHEKTMTNHGEVSMDAMDVNSKNNGCQYLIVTKTLNKNTTSEWHIFHKTLNISPSS